MRIATGKLNDSALSALRDKLKRLNKRAVRLGLEPMRMMILRTETVSRKMPSGLDESVCINHIEVTGCAPRINGWVVAARIEFTNNGNLVHVAPGIGSVDNRYRTIGNICEHCNTNRRRNDIIVIRHFDGREICVGRNCLADYIRTESAEGLIEAASWGDTVSEAISEFESDYYGSGGRPVESVETLVQAASICIRKLGWVSGREAYDNGRSSTRDDVCNLLVPPTGHNAIVEWKLWIENNGLTVTDYDKDLATKAIEWAKSVQPGDSDYLHNLNVLASAEMATWDNAGYIVSIIPAYNRAVERETERAALAEKKGRKGYIGEPKKRMRGIKATCVGIRSFEGRYGVTTMLRFEHRISESEYAVLIWFASGDKTEDFDLDTEYTFDATCKGHNDHEKYGKQVQINRLKLL